MKIQAKIISVFLTAFIAVFMTIAVVISIYTAISRVNQAFQLVNASSIAKAQHLRSYLKSQKEVIIMLGASTVFRDFLAIASSSADYAAQKQRVVDRLDRTIAADLNINELFLLDDHGFVIASTNNKHEGMDRSADSFFVEGQKDTFIKDVYMSDITNALAWGMSNPIKNDTTGDLMGVVVARMDIKTFFEILQIQSQLGKTGETFLVNKDKYFLTPSLFLGNNVVLKQKIDTQNVKDCFDQNYINEARAMGDYFRGAHIYRDYRNVLTLGTHEYIPETQWCLVTKVDELEIFQPIFIILLIFFGTSIAGIIIFLAISIRLAKNITKPIEDLEKELQIIQKGDLDHRVGTDAQDEIGELSREFDALTAAVKQSRADVDRKVEEQTREIVQKNKGMEDQQKAILNILEDVELEKKKAESLATDLSKFQLAVENASDHIVITDPEGKILYANKAVERITGFTPADVVGKKVGNKELWGGLMELPFYQLLWKTIKTDKKVFSGEIQNHRRNGEKYIAKASIAPILDKNGDVAFFVAIERDVTREKEIDRMKTEFISLASHQLRTPLAAMKWFSEMLLAGDAGVLTKDQTEYIGNISLSVQRMIELVNSLLNISRIESGRLIIDPKPTDIKKLLDELFVDLKKQFIDKNLTYAVSVDDNLPMINVDPRLIREVYTNLLTNAIKYTPKEGKISIFVSKKEDQLISQVTDTGYGIPDVDKERVFQKFFRGRNIMKLETEGTGLGLYLIKAIVESSGGKIWFESIEGKGTTFWFSLPMSGMTAKSGDVGLEQKNNR